MNKAKNSIAAILYFTFFILSFHVKAQEPFSVHIVPTSINGAPGLHSFAYSQFNGKWMLIGGRKNGLHDSETPFAFDVNYANDSIWVLDVNSNQSWGTAVASLPDSIREPITSTNMEYFQDSATLYLVGGYGWKSSANEFRTFPTLTAVDIPGLQNAVINGTTINPYFRQITDSNLAVTGGELDKMDSTYYLVFGHQFDGHYSTVDTLGYFVQHYTNAIRKFTIVDDGTHLSINNYQTVSDTANFRRRDFNLAHQIFPNRQEGLTAFGGVFRQFTTLPYLTPIDIMPGSYNVINSFNQNLEQYSTANMPVYDSLYNMMHTIFFGGISLYYIDSSSVMTLDSLVPFVNTVSKITRDSTGALTEYVMPLQMPGLLGANAEFIIVPTINSYHKKIINLNALTGNTLVGYIVGGINSTLPNIFSQSPPPSTANNIIFKVYIDKTPTSVAETAIANDIQNFGGYPNPFSKNITLEFILKKAGHTTVSVYDNKGALLTQILNKDLKPGSQRLIWNSGNYSAGNYFFRITQGSYSKSIRIQKSN